MGLSSTQTDEQAQSDDEAAIEEELFDWAECMRDAGIDVPDPTRDSDGNLVPELWCGQWRTAAVSRARDGRRARRPRPSPRGG
jgi:hypothetical protein